jgi:hypothetical protein
MKIPLLLISVLSFSFFAQSQLNCKKLKGRYGDSTVCFHQSGTKSTVEFHDRENDRYQWFIAYNVKGNKIFEGGHGYRHGGGSLDVKYHSNGSISSVRSTFQPDGGIQYYDVTAYFAEDGSFIRREDNSWDRQLTIQPYVHHSVETEKPVHEVRDSIQYLLKNTTKHKIKILLVDTKNSDIRRVEIIRRNKVIDLGTFEKKRNLNGLFDYYRIEILPANSKGRIILISNEALSNSKKEYMVFIEIE